MSPHRLARRLVSLLLLLGLGFVAGVALHASAAGHSVSEGGSERRVEEAPRRRIPRAAPASLDARAALDPPLVRPSNRAAERRYIEHIDPGEWLARFGAVEKHTRPARP